MKDPFLFHDQTPVFLRSFILYPGYGYMGITGEEGKKRGGVGQSSSVVMAVG